MGLNVNPPCFRNSHIYLILNISSCIFLTICSYGLYAFTEHKIPFDSDIYNYIWLYVMIVFIVIFTILFIYTCIECSIKKKNQYDYLTFPAE
jgi:hypothetical protein